MIWLDAPQFVSEGASAHPRNARLLYFWASGLSCLILRDIQAPPRLSSSSHVPSLSQEVQMWQ